jgi:hypothetical protein
MKRCPQCEFIYEDDQSLCDMDGFLLVFDSQVLPKPKTPRKVSATPQWRSRVVPAMAALVLATVLCLVYFVSTNQQPASRAYPPTVVTSTQPASNTSKSASDAPVTNAQPAANAIETKAPVSAPTPAVTTTNDNKVKSVPVAGTKEAKESNEKPKAKATQKTQSTTQAPKSDSKIGSLLKKTGRILKKPFKL